MREAAPAPMPDADMATQARVGVAPDGKLAGFDVTPKSAR